VEPGWGNDGECGRDFGRRCSLRLRCGSKRRRGKRSEPDGHRQELKAKEDSGEFAIHRCHNGRWYQEWVARKRGGPARFGRKPRRRTPNAALSAARRRRGCARSSPLTWPPRAGARAKSRSGASSSRQNCASDETDGLSPCLHANHQKTAPQTHPSAGVVHVNCYTCPLLVRVDLLKVAGLDVNQRRGVERAPEGRGNLLRSQRRHLIVQVLVELHGAAPAFVAGE